MFLRPTHRASMCPQASLQGLTILGHLAYPAPFLPSSHPPSPSLTSHAPLVAHRCSLCMADASVGFLTPAAATMRSASSSMRAEPGGVALSQAYSPAAKLAFSPRNQI